MKTCPDCCTKLSPPMVVQCGGVSGYYPVETCGKKVEFTLDDLAQHLRDSGEYAVIRMDDPAVVALRKQEEMWRRALTEDAALCIGKEDSIPALTLDVCLKAGILKAGILK